MVLDLVTLHVVTTLNAGTMAAVWFALAHAYRQLHPARTWASAYASLAAGGLLLAVAQHTQAAPLAQVAGTLCMMSGFTLFATGLHQLLGQRPPWRLQLCYLGLMLTLLLQWHDHSTASRWLVALGQSAPLLYSAGLLLRQRAQRTVGSRLVTGALLLAAFTALAEASAMPIRQHSAWLPVLSELGLTLSSLLVGLGLILMSVERLQADATQLTRIDELTGVANRRHLYDRLQQQVALWRRTRTPFSLLLIDLDHFKHINDTYGHRTGDRTLRRLVATLQPRLRSSDLLARVGGDEFCVLLPATTLCQAARLADDLRALVSTSPLLSTAGKAAPVSLSIGVAEWHSTLNDAADLLDAADQAMYQVKADGRDGCAVASAQNERQRWPRRATC